MKRDTLITIIYFCLILILIGLTFRVYYDGQGYNCNECIIQFKSKPNVAKDYFPEINVSVLELYKTFNEGECIVKWNKNSGYQYLGGLE